MVFLWDDDRMKAFFLKLTRIIEANAKIYISIIVGIGSCLMLFVAEAVHVQNIVDALNSKDQAFLSTVIRPLSDQYTLIRSVVLILSVLWCVYEYRRTKRKLGL